MNRAIVILSAFLLLIGCKGPSGSKGDKGDRGDPGPGTISTYTGFVTSNSQYIYTPAYTGTEALSVFIGDGINNAELPYFLPAQGINTYYLAQNQGVWMYNASLALASRYVVVVIKSGGAANLIP